MLKRTNFTLFIPLLFIFIGCQPIMMKLYGIKKPKEENKESIYKKANKLGLDTTNIVSSTYEGFMKTLRKYRIPDASLYDAHGKYIEYRSSDTACNAGLFDFIPTLKRGAVYNQPDSASLQTEWKSIRDLNGNPLKEPEQADFYLLIYWTIFTGKLNKDHVKIWEELAKANTNCRIKVIKVNLDVQSWWDPEIKNKLLKK